MKSAATNHLETGRLTNKLSSKAEHGCAANKDLVTACEAKSLGDAQELLQNPTEPAGSELSFADSKK